jgi:DNA polymerase-1
MSQLNIVHAALKRAHKFAFDTETEEDGSLVGLSLYTTEMGSVFIPMGFDTSDYAQFRNGNKILNATFDDRQLNMGTVMDNLQPIFSDPDKLCIGHNIKFDMHVVNRYGLKIKNQLCDTMTMAWLVDENYFVGLKPRVMREFKFKMLEFSDIVGKGNGKEKIINLTIPFVAHYARNDAEWTYKLYEKYEPELVRLKLDDMFYRVMMPMLRILFKMERTGVLIDQAHMDALDKRFTGEIAVTQAKIFSQVGSQFNLNSTKQMADILFNKFKLKPIKYSKKTKAPSTDEETLIELSKNSAFCKDIINHRGLQKLKGTYVDGVRSRLKNGRIHTSFNQARTVTGRLSSSDPNLQNIPIRVENGKEIRNMFVAGPGNKLLVFDEKNIELRLIAHFSKDRVMIDAFNHGKDLHMITACKIFKRPADKITKAQRDIAKAVNFGISYGEGPTALSEQLGISKDEAILYVDGFFMTYPMVLPWIESVKRYAHEKTYVRTLLGRYRRVPEINEPLTKDPRDKQEQRRVFGIRARAERQAVNAIIQGTAMDIIALAMIKIAPQLGKSCKMLIQVHDELVFECAESRTGLYTPIIKREMENPFKTGFKLSVPIETDVAIVDKWGNAK